jgi:hypothetical protein
MASASITRFPRARIAPQIGVARIDIWGRPAGYVVPGRDSVRFVAGSPHFSPLDGATFPTIGHARLAAIARARTVPPYADDWKN